MGYGHVREGAEAVACTLALFLGVLQSTGGWTSGFSCTSWTCQTRRPRGTTRARMTRSGPAPRAAHELHRRPAVSLYWEA